MKNRYIRNLLALLPFCVLFLIGCEDEEKIRVPELIDGVNMRIQLEPEFSFFDFENLQDGKLVFSLFSENQDIERVELYLQYYSQEKDSLGKSLLWLTFEQDDFGSDGIIEDVTVTSSELAEFLGLSLDDLAGGDRIDVSNFTHLDDGRVYPDTVLKDTDYEAINIEPSIIESSATTSFTSGFSAFVACPSSIDGSYSTVVNATSTDPCCPTPVEVESEVTITRLDPINYSVTNFAAGAYAEFYCGPYGLCAPDFGGLGASMLDVCGNITLSAGYWGSMGTGTVEQSTGVITIEWQNVFGDAGTTVYTPK